MGLETFDGGGKKKKPPTVPDLQRKLRCQKNHPMWFLYKLPNGETACKECEKKP